jgi:hypothetical protein
VPAHEAWRPRRIVTRDRGGTYGQETTRNNEVLEFTRFSLDIWLTRQSGKAHDSDLGRRDLGQMDALVDRQWKRIEVYALGITKLIVQASLIAFWETGAVIDIFSPAPRPCETSVAMSMLCLLVFPPNM